MNQLLIQTRQTLTLATLKHNTWLTQKAHILNLFTKYYLLNIEIQTMKILNFQK